MKCKNGIECGNEVSIGGVPRWECTENDRQPFCKHISNAKQMLSENTSSFSDPIDKPAKAKTDKK